MTNLEWQVCAEEWERSVNEKLRLMTNSTFNVQYIIFHENEKLSWKTNNITVGQIESISKSIFLLSTFVYTKFIETS